MKKLLISLMVVFLIWGTVLAQEKLEPPQEGAIQTYYPDGQLKEEVFYQSGKLHGQAKKYFKNGTVHQEAAFEKGELVGIGRVYYPTGIIKNEYQYKDGKVHGIKQYDEAGKLISNTFKEKPREGELIQGRDRVWGQESTVITLKGSGSQAETMEDFFNNFEQPSGEKQVEMLVKKYSKEYRKIMKENPWLVYAVLFVVIFGYLIIRVPVYLLAQKTGNGSAGWLAFLPVFDMLLILWMGQKSGWWILVSLVPLVGPLILLILYIICWVVIAETRGKPAWVGLLVIIPVIGFFVKWYLAIAD